MRRCAGFARDRPDPRRPAGRSARNRGTDPPGVRDSGSSFRQGPQDAPQKATRTSRPRCWSSVTVRPSASRTLSLGAGRRSGSGTNPARWSRSASIDGSRESIHLPALAAERTHVIHQRIQVAAGEGLAEGGHGRVALAFDDRLADLLVRPVADRAGEVLRRRPEVRRVGTVPATLGAVASQAMDLVEQLPAPC